MAVETRAMRPQTRSKASTAYLYTWAAVAACGLAYVGVAATHPEMIGAVLPLAEPTADQAYANRAVADMADELATLRKWVNDMQHELATTRNAMQEQAAQQTSLHQRLTAAEERLPAVKEVRTDAASRVLAPRVARAAPAPQIPAEQTTAQPHLADISNVRVINPAGSSPITTGSVAAAAPAAVAPAPAAARPPAPGAQRGIEIGAADSLDSLRSKWGDLAGRNTDALGELAPRYRLATDGRQSPFTLVAGPFGSPADASKACTQLRARGIACRVSDYSGSAF